MIEKIKIDYYRTPSGRAPYLKWFDSLDRGMQTIVQLRIDDIELFGNFGDHRHIKGSTKIFELRFHISPGLRIYFVKQREVVVLLLCAGDKGSQVHDIEKAKKYWDEWKDKA